MCRGRGDGLPYLFHLGMVIETPQSRIDLTQGSSTCEAFVERFVMQQNIEHCQALLKITPDPAERRRIEKLLLDQEAKLNKYDEDQRGR